jgi:hypothetical protein
MTPDFQRPKAAVNRRSPDALRWPRLLAVAERLWRLARHIVPGLVSELKFVLKGRRKCKSITAVIVSTVPPGRRSLGQDYQTLCVWLISEVAPRPPKSLGLCGVSEVRRLRHRCFGAKSPLFGNRTIFGVNLFEQNARILYLFEVVTSFQKRNEQKIAALRT